MKISELPQEIKELALLRQKECVPPFHDKKTDELCLAFNWSETKEGFDYWEEYYRTRFKTIEPKTDKEEITDIIEKKIAYLQSVNEKMFYVSIGILKDLIKEIKEKQ